jgi:hypothetical protein
VVKPAGSAVGDATAIAAEWCELSHQYNTPSIVAADTRTLSAR